MTNKLVIVMEGGSVRNVYSSEKLDVELRIFDVDDEQDDPDYVNEKKFADGTSVAGFYRSNPTNTIY